MSASLLRLGQTLRGGLGRYFVTVQIQGTVWLAKRISKTPPCGFAGQRHGFSFARSKFEKTVIVKGVKDHRGVENERDVLKRFRDRSPHLRRLADEIEDPPKPTIIVLQHLDGDIATASKSKTLNLKELKSVSRCSMKMTMCIQVTVTDTLMPPDASH